jgi:hypothetical protein
MPHQSFAHHDRRDINPISPSSSEITRFLRLFTSRKQDPLKTSNLQFHTILQFLSLQFSFPITSGAIIRMSDVLGFGHIAISSTSPHISIHHDRQHGPTTLEIFLRELCGVRDRDIEEQEEWAKRERQHRYQQWAEGMHKDHMSRRKMSSMETNKSCCSRGSANLE